VEIPNKALPGSDAIILNAAMIILSYFPVRAFIFVYLSIKRDHSCSGSRRKRKGYPHGCG
jgi:hypothetical protein